MALLKVKATDGSCQGLGLFAVKTTVCFRAALLL